MLLMQLVGECDLRARSVFELHNLVRDKNGYQPLTDLLLPLARNQASFTDLKMEILKMVPTAPYAKIINEPGLPFVARIHGFYLAFEFDTESSNFKVWYTSEHFLPLPE
jgi:hypothetical protein